MDEVYTEPLTHDEDEAIEGTLEEDQEVLFDEITD